MGESLVDSCTSKAMDSEKFCLKWNEFEDNIRNSFKSFRSEGTLFDVTLATDDGHQIQAHKVILSAGSDFFRNIFSQCNQSNMLVYLKGISRVDLENVTNFLYNGETLVTQQDLNTFLETAQELKVTRLQNVEDDNKSDLDVQESEFHRRIDIPLEDTEAHRTMAKSIYDTFQQYQNTPSEEKEKEPIIYTCEECGRNFKHSTGVSDHIIVKHTKAYPLKCDLCDKGFLKSEKNNRLKIHRQKCEGPDSWFLNDAGMFRKKRSEPIEPKIWTCEECGKVFSKLSAYKRHMKKHFKIKDFPCLECSMKYADKRNLINHVKLLHPESVSKYERVRDKPCDLCDELFASQVQIEYHKVKEHGKGYYSHCEFCFKGFIKSKARLAQMRYHESRCPGK